MKLTVVFSANAGCSVTMGGVRFWIDALHNKKTSPYQTVTPELFSALMEHPDFTDPELLIYTHDHPDHYSPELTEAALRRFPGASVITPFAVPGFTASGKDLEFDYLGLHFHFFPLPHDGAEYADVPLYGFTVTCGARTLLIPSDCAVGAPALRKALIRADVSHIDCAIVDFPWASLRRGQQLLSETGIRHLLICHFPSFEEDIGRYIDLTERAVRRLEGMDIRFLTQPLQKEEIEIV